MKPKTTAPMWTRIGFTLCLSLFFVIAGCDSAALDAQPDPEPTSTACGGNGVLCNVSGTAGELGGGGNDGPALSAFHYWPMDVTLAAGEIIYVVDWNNHCVRKIDSNGIISRLIGSGNLGDTYDRPASDINLNHPTGLTIGPDGMFYLAAWHNWKVKVIDPQTMYTTAPYGTIQGFAGDGGPVSQAKFDLPSSVVFGPDGRMYIADQGNQRVRVVDDQGIVTTIAGSDAGFADGVGEAAMFDLPKGPDAGPGGRIALNVDGTALYLADTNNHRIRMIDLATYQVTTVAGTGTAGYAGDGGAATAAMLYYPRDIAVSHDNEVYVADSENNVIRKIAADGTISTVVGTGEAGFSPDATPALQARLNKPMGVAFDEASHTLFIADTFNQQVKKVELDH